MNKSRSLFLVVFFLAGLLASSVSGADLTIEQIKASAATWPNQIKVSELRQAIRESEVLVYALGIDGVGRGTTQSPRTQPRPPITFPIPGIGQPRRFPFALPQIVWGGSSANCLHPQIPQIPQSAIA
jgi:hypothetical protein